MGRRQYASSVYSQKSTTSAKSGKSFLSLTTSASIWPSKETAQEDQQAEENATKPTLWQSMLKNWKKKDSDSINSSSSVSNKLKQLFVTKKRNSVVVREEDSSHSEEKGSSISSTTLHQQQPTGILINRGEDSEEAIAERKRRRHQRRENILRLQQKKQSSSLLLYHPQQESSLVMDESSSTSSSSDNNNTITSEDAVLKDGWGYYNNPRIMFVEPSPVPRFRNVAPPPPPSPPYLNIVVRNEDSENYIIKSPTIEEDELTVFGYRKLVKKTPTTVVSSSASTFNYDKHVSIDHPSDEQHMSLLIDTLRSTIKQPKPRICFDPPFHRGQTALFTLRNTMPEEHVILFKFLTNHHNSGSLQQSDRKRAATERYFVRPSAGKIMMNEDHIYEMDIRVFLNQIPHAMTVAMKDEIIIRWAVIQRNTEIEDWVNSLQESTRRRWIDMLDERWSDQVIIRMTRIKIRFNT
ncbi:MAG: hypothetical protein EXX96DRAFT_586278 [Benjaminiella poitrasii]|nr:MAG: hypothetical protein EXX96DRAFT_586278 [Benjaminiella poitrasii]